MTLCACCDRALLRHRGETTLCSPCEIARDELRECVHAAISRLIAISSDPTREEVNA